MARILAVGGGSGGHVTPVVAVFSELQKSGKYELRFWCDKKFGPNAKRLVAKLDPSIPVHMIAAGKLRRYHGMSLWQQLHPGTLLPNIMDAAKVLAGFLQSFWKLLWWRPDVIFIKGGYVCLPVGYAARLLRIPLVLHDSDAHPGLTNRLLAPFAAKIGTGAPLEYYSYPADKAAYVGIPVAAEFRQYTEAERRELKQQLGFDPSRPLVVVTGGGLGAVRLNNAIVAGREMILDEASLFLVSGTHQYQELVDRTEPQDGWRLQAFVHDGMARVLAAADVVVTRAGATTLLELAALARPTIIVPNRQLTAGHQLKNAKVYQDALAAIVVDEAAIANDELVLAKTVVNVLRAPQIRRDLSCHFAAFAKPDAAAEMAEMILSVIQGQGR
ncbi:MAG: glycosyltransferase [Candidatus Saccharibacteria bacterium]|nr:glycosyltransferase [Candidatus Saccharibacteria bacterium]